MCSGKELQEITQTVAASARDLYGDRLKKVILYGSYARGDYDAESDIDMMVLVEQAGEVFSPFCDLTAAMLLQYGVLVSVAVKDAAMFDKYKDILPYYQAVQKEGIVCG